MAKLPDPIIFSETNLLSFKKQAKTKIVNSTRKYSTWMLLKTFFETMKKNLFYIIYKNYFTLIF